MTTANSWAPVNPAETGISQPGVYLCMDDIAPHTAQEFGAIKVRVAMAGSELPWFNGIAAKVEGRTITLLKVDFAHAPGSSTVSATIIGVLGEGILTEVDPVWVDKARQARGLLVIIGPRQVDSHTPSAVLAFQQDAEIGVVPLAI